MLRKISVRLSRFLIFPFDAITVFVFWTFYAATLAAAFIDSSIDISFSFSRSPTLFSVKLLRTV